MPILKKRIRRATSRSDRTSVFAALPVKLKKQNLEILVDDSSKGEMVIPCVRLLINWILWCCWSSKLLFEVRERANGQTVIDVYGLPDQLRSSAKESELSNPRLILSRLVLEEL